MGRFCHTSMFNTLTQGVDDFLKCGLCIFSLCRNEKFLLEGLCEV